MHRDKFGATALNSYIYICSLLHLVKERIAYVALHKTICFERALASSSFAIMLRIS